jgi:hypothetical protein
LAVSLDNKAARRTRIPDDIRRVTPPQALPLNGLFRLIAILGKIAPMPRQQKITLREMRESGPTRLIVYCGDYKCAHSVVIDAGRWAGDARLSDLEPRFTCQVCGHRGADTMPLFEPARMGTDGS